MPDVTFNVNGKSRSTVDVCGAATAQAPGRRGGWRGQVPAYAAMRRPGARGGLWVMAERGRSVDLGVKGGEP